MTERVPIPTIFIFLVLALLAAPLDALAQLVPSIVLNRVYGGDRNDEGYVIAQTGDTGYAIAGYTGDTLQPGLPDYHGGFEDAWILKLDNAGTIVRERCLGGSNQEECNWMVQTRDGGYCLAIRTESIDGDVVGSYGDGSDGWIVKLRGDFSIQWKKILGGTNWDDVYSIVQTTDGGYAVAGYTRSNDGTVVGHHGGTLQDDDAWITKLDSNGSIQWTRCYGGLESDWAQSIVQTPDGGYCFCGHTSSRDGDVTGYLGGLENAWVVKIDSIGAIQWQRCFGGDSITWGASIAMTSDGGFLVIGGTYDSVLPRYHGGGDAWIAKLGSNGELEWQNCYGGSQIDKGWNITELRNGNYLLAGMVMSNDGDVSGNHSTPMNGDAWVTELDPNGAILWQHCYGGSNHDIGFFVHQLTNGTIAFAGASASQDGDTPSNHGNEDMWFMLLADPAGITPNPVAAAVPSLTLSPDPASREVTVRFTGSLLPARLELRNLLGQTIASKTIPDGETNASFDLSDLVPGTYFMVLRAAASYLAIPFQVLCH